MIMIIIIITVIVTITTVLIMIIINMHMPVRIVLHNSFAHLRVLFGISSLTAAFHQLKSLRSGATARAL
jgi:hypothetical protein